ncbi:MAG TPA: antitoxin VapB family protein [Methylomirabilota bacterium]|jgi:predicted CopG family antitoxin
MAVKTITIDLEAYEILARHKGPGQSFSEVIKERLGRQMTGKDLRAVVARAGVSEDTLNAIEAQLRGRRRHPARSARL